MVKAVKKDKTHATMTYATTTTLVTSVFDQMFGVSGTRCTQVADVCVALCISMVMFGVTLYGIARVNVHYMVI